MLPHLSRTAKPWRSFLPSFEAGRAGELGVHDTMSCMPCTCMIVDIGIQTLDANGFWHYHSKEMKTAASLLRCETSLQFDFGASVI